MITHSFYLIMPSNYDPKFGTGSPPRCASRQYPVPLPDRQSSAQPSISGHGPERLTPAVASPAPAAAPHPRTTHNTSVSAACSSASSQKSAAKPPSPTPLSALQPAQIEHSAAPSPSTLAPGSPPTLRPPFRPATPYTAPREPQYGCRSGPAAAPIPSRHTAESSAGDTC